MGAGRPTCVLQHFLQHGHEARELKLLLILARVAVLGGGGGDKDTRVSPAPEVQAILPVH